MVIPHFKLKLANIYAVFLSNIIEIFVKFSTPPQPFDLFIIRKFEADASGIESCGSTYLQNEIDFSHVYKACEGDLRSLKERFPNLSNRHTLYQLIYGKLVCYRLKYIISKLSFPCHTNTYISYFFL